MPIPGAWRESETTKTRTTKVVGWERGRRSPTAEGLLDSLPVTCRPAPNQGHPAPLNEPIALPSSRAGRPMPPVAGGEGPRGSRSRGQRRRAGDDGRWCASGNTDATETGATWLRAPRRPRARERR